MVPGFSLIMTDSSNDSFFLMTRSFTDALYTLFETDLRAVEPINGHNHAGTYEFFAIVSAYWGLYSDDTDDARAIALVCTRLIGDALVFLASLREFPTSVHALQTVVTDQFVPRQYDTEKMFQLIALPRGPRAMFALEWDTIRRQIREPDTVFLKCLLISKLTQWNYQQQVSDVTSTIDDVFELWQ